MSAHHDYIEQVFARYYRDLKSSRTRGEEFVRFGARMLVQRPPYDVSDEALEDGITDGALDGGIDAVYTLLNGEPLELDSELVEGKVPESARFGHARLDVIVVQTKMHGAGTTAVEKLSANLPRLMNFAAKDLTDEEFNELVLERFEIARQAWRNLAGYDCTMTFRVHLATLSDIDPISPETQSKINHLTRTLEQALPGVSEVECRVDGARSLISRYQAETPVDYEIAFQKNFPSGDGVVALVTLSEYANFVEDGTGRVSARLLEDNVRDWQGEVEVNKAIRATLESHGVTPFWWLNNGVTIVCSSVTTVGESLKITRPRIVNGLQTTRVVYDYLKNNPSSAARDELILLRVVKTENEEQMDAVIRATNSQTAVDPASLRATDQIQRLIEEEFAAENIFYDRRKGSFRDARKGSQEMLTIRDLGQVLTTILLGRPDLARGRPTSLLKDNDRYQELFGDRTKLKVFLFAAKLWIRTGQALLSGEAGVDAVTRRYLRFHILGATVAKRLGRWPTPGKRLERLAASGWEPSDEDIRAVVDIVSKELDQFIDEEDTSMQNATKAHSFAVRLKELDWSSST